MTVEKQKEIEDRKRVRLSKFVKFERNSKAIYMLYYIDLIFKLVLISARNYVKK